MRLTDNSSDHNTFSTALGVQVYAQYTRLRLCVWPWKQEDSEQQPCHKSELCEAHDKQFSFLFF